MLEVFFVLNFHLHRFEVKSDFSGIHFHVLKGYVRNNLGLEILHFHTCSGTTPVSDHAHFFSSITGPPMKTQNGHIHKLSGVLQETSGHLHKFSGLTDENISYLSDTNLVSPQV